MHLDISTLMAMESFVAACAGATLLFAWSQNRRTPALALWGGAYIGAAGGVFALMLGAGPGHPIWSMVGGNLLVLAQGLTWKAARTLDGKPSPFVLWFMGLAVVGLAGAVPGPRDIVGSIGLAVSSIYLFAAASTLWLGRRKERLSARWPIIVLTAIHAAVLLVGAVSTLLGSTDQNQVPTLIGLFGLIHFESVIFWLGTTVFILTLVKERAEAASRAAAKIDSLTGIANRAAFMVEAEEVLKRCRHEGAPISTVMFDLDRFKLVNDTHGHAVGDAVIQKFCEIVVAALRPCDVFGRIGGEEFAAVLPGSSIEAAGVRADRIRTAFSEGCRFVGDCQVNGTVSGGVSVSLKAEHSLSELLKYSDEALYRAKIEGRNRIKRDERTETAAGQSTVIRVA